MLMMMRNDDVCSKSFDVIFQGLTAPQTEIEHVLSKTQNDKLFLKNMQKWHYNFCRPSGS